MVTWDVMDYAFQYIKENNGIDTESTELSTCLARTCFFIIYFLKRNKFLFVLFIRQ
jgi:hypothetical protein